VTGLVGEANEVHVVHPQRSTMFMTSVETDCSPSLRASPVSI
jgi:hypothetical protein